MIAWDWCHLISPDSRHHRKRIGEGGAAAGMCPSRTVAKKTEPNFRREAGWRKKITLKDKIYLIKNISLTREYL